MRWFWMKRKHAPAIEEALRKLDDVVHDDELIDQIEARSERVMREDNLAPYIMRALGLR